MKASELIRAAIPEVARGRCQGELMNKQGFVCMVGGLAKVAGAKIVRQGDQPYVEEEGALKWPNGSVPEVFDEVMKTLFPASMEHKCSGPGDYNDRHPLPDVLTFMEKVAIGLEESDK